MTLQDLLDKACNGMSDNKTSQRIGISRVMFSYYRNNRKTPSDDVIERLAEEAGVSPVEAYLAVYAEKVSNPMVAEAFRHSRLVAE